MRQLEAALEHAVSSRKLRVSLLPMPRHQRAVVHELAKAYGITTQAYGNEPQRRVDLFVPPTAALPSIRLARCTAPDATQGPCLYLGADDISVLTSLCSCESLLPAWPAPAAPRARTPSLPVPLPPCSPTPRTPSPGARRPPPSPTRPRRTSARARPPRPSPLAPAVPSPQSLPSRTRGPRTARPPGPPDLRLPAPPQPRLHRRGPDRNAPEGPVGV